MSGGEVAEKKSGGRRRRPAPPPPTQAFRRRRSSVFRENNTHLRARSRLGQMRNPGGSGRSFLKCGTRPFFGEEGRGCGEEVEVGEFFFLKREGREKKNRREL